MTEHSQMTRDAAIERDFALMGWFVGAVTGWGLFLLSLWRMWSVCR